MTFTAHEKLQMVLQKAYQLEERFSDSKSKAIEQVETLNNNIQEELAEAKEIYKMYVLGDVELSAYQDTQSKLDSLKAKLKATQDKVESIDAVKQEELAKLYRDEVVPLQKDLQYERAVNKRDTREAMYKAKEIYLDAIKEQGKQFRVTKNPEKRVEHLKVKAGLQYTSYAGLFDDSQDLLFNSYDNSKGMDVRPEELRNAYIYNK